MSKIILDDLTSIQNDPTAVDTINDNSAIIEGAFDRVLFRDGTAPNNMEADLDMNSHKILNLPAPRSPLEPARLKDIGDAPQYAADAAASAAAALASELAAAVSAADASADASAAHADRLLADADVVLTHADVVLTHADVVTTGNNATTATTQAGIATTQAGIATTQAGNASTSASTATTQAGIATTQAGNAATSASNAHTSELNAATSETNSATSLFNFRSQYLGPSATNPTVDGNGNPVTSGDLYYNTTANELRVYDGSMWVTNTASPVNSVFGRTGTVTAATNDYTFAQIGSKPTTVSGYGISDAVTLTDTQTLTNKTLTSPVISTIVNTGTLTLPTSSDTLVGKATTDTLTNKTFDTAGTGNSFSINGVAATTNTGTGAVVRATSPTLVTPALGTPSSATLTNATGLPVSTGIAGLGAGISTFLATPSSANLAAAVTSETGSGALVFGTSPVITTPTGIVKGDVGLGNVDNTSDATKNSAAVTLTNKTIDYASNTLTGVSPRTRTINAQTGTTYTFVIGDAGNTCTFANASPVTVTVPPNSSVAFPTGTQIDVAATGAGQVTLAQGSGVTINSEDSKKKLTKQYSGGTLVKTASDTWLLMGSIST